MKYNFLIITPVINADYLFKETFLSIINLKGLGSEFTIKYIIADAGTTSTIENTYINELISNYNIKGLDVEHIKYKDKSMYDGLSNALINAKDEYDIFAYINAGDMYSPYSFLKIKKYKNNCNTPFWVTGCTGSYNQDGELYKVIEPVAYPLSLIKSGSFGTYLPFIQQESTFCSYDLISDLNFKELSSLKYAGDYYIWKHIAEKNVPLNIVPIWLSGFREHEGQLSSVFKDEYMTEMKEISSNKVNLVCIIKGMIIFSLYILHPRCRPVKIIKKIKKWK